MESMHACNLPRAVDLLWVGDLATHEVRVQRSWGIFVNNMGFTSDMFRVSGGSIGGGPQCSVYMEASPFGEGRSETHLV